MEERDVIRYDGRTLKIETKRQGRYERTNNSKSKYSNHGTAHENSRQNPQTPSSSFDRLVILLIAFFIDFDFQITGNQRIQNAFRIFDHPA